MPIPIPYPGQDILGPTVELAWVGDGFILEEASSIPGTWEDSDATVATDGSGGWRATDPTFTSLRFYRLKDLSDPGNPAYGDPSGYLERDLPAGWSMICFPFRHPDGNTFNTAFHLTDEDVGTSLYRYRGAGLGWDTSVWVGTATGWIPDFEIGPTEGAFIQTAHPVQVRMGGELRVGGLPGPLPYPVAAGYALVGPPWPVWKDLDGMGFPAESGDLVFRWTGAGYEPATWFGEWFSPMTFNPAEAFWSYKGSRADWVGAQPIEIP